MSHHRRTNTTFHITGGLFDTDKAVNLRGALLKACCQFKCAFGVQEQALQVCTYSGSSSDTETEGETSASPHQKLMSRIMRGRSGLVPCLPCVPAAAGLSSHLTQLSTHS